MREKLWQYAVIVHPTENEQKDGERARIVVPLSEPILARNESEVVMLATRQIPEDEMAKNADRLEVAVRPF